MPKKGDDLTATASSLQQSSESVLSAIKENQGRLGRPTLVPAPGSEVENDSKRTSDEPKVPDTPTAEEREKERKKKEAEKLKQAKLKEQAAAEARADEIANSPWIACRPKVNKARVDLLDRIWKQLGVGDYTGTKQEFYDEGLALLEKKYAHVAKKILSEQSS